MTRREYLISIMSDAELILLVAQGVTTNPLPACTLHRAKRWENAKRCGVPLESLRASDRTASHRGSMRRGSIVDGAWMEQEIRGRAAELFIEGVNQEDALLLAVGDVEQFIRSEGLRIGYRPRKSKRAFHEEAA